MRRLAILSISLAVLCAPALAVETPRVIPRSEQIARPIDEVFGTLRHYFNDSSLSGFRLTSADQKTWTLVAIRPSIDGSNWNQWAFCKASGEQMLYKFDEGTATVTVKLQKAGKQETFTSISADMEGHYSLGSQEATISCTSTGRLEQDLLSVAGPAQGAH
jgi:hypothetical protein